MSVKQATIGFPNVYFDDTNEQVFVNLEVKVPGDPTVEADIVSYIKTRLASASGVGTVRAQKTELSNTYI